MEDLFKIVQSIELKQYVILLDKHDIQDIVKFSLKIINAFSNSKHNDEKMFSACLVQILQRIAVKTKKPYNQRKKAIKFNLTPAEFYALKELVDLAEHDDLPLVYPLLVQLDTQ
jgi:hypothetical protein